MVILKSLTDTSAQKEEPQDYNLFNSKLLLNELYFRKIKRKKLFMENTS